MKRFFAGIIIILGVLGFIIYETNYDTQNVCLNSENKKFRLLIYKNPEKALPLLKKWNNACQAELIKKKNISLENEKNKGCVTVEKATSAALSYAAILREVYKDSETAEKTIGQTLSYLEPYSKCVEYEVFGSMLSASLKKYK